MADRLTDAELIETLKVVQGSETLAAAASTLGIAVRNLQLRITSAHNRNLTPETVVTSELDRTKARVKSLERDLQATKRENDTAEAIREQIYGLAEQSPEPPAWVQKAAAKSHTGVPMTIWSDWHYGETIDAAEVGGVNTFNVKVANDRIGQLIDKTVSLAFEHMTNAKYPGIVVCLGGDFISGDIHEELSQTNQGTSFQAIEQVRDQLIMGLTAMADKFGRVFVPCVVGNHGRNTHKPTAKRRVYTSFEWNLYNQLELWFRDDKRVTFLIPSESDAYFNVLGHRFLLTHGDSLGVKGGDGIIGAIGPIARGTFKVGRSEAQIGRDFDTLIMGHWHTYIPRGDAIPVIVNGALKGYDEYARLFLRVPYSRPSQALWFVHDKLGITAQWQIYLDAKRKTADSSEWLTFQKRPVAA